MNLSVDASVFVAAARNEEAHYAVSRQFLLRARSLGATIICPTLVLPECAAAIARSTGSAALAQELVDLIGCFPDLELVSLEENLAREAVEVATTHRLRGADSVYVAVAATFQAALITWDSEMLVRGTQVTSTSTPRGVDSEDPGARLICLALPAFCTPAWPSSIRSWACPRCPL